MLSVILLGTGNVAQHLYNALAALDTVNLKQVYGRNTEALSYFKNIAVTNNPDHILNADVYLIAVNDDAIKAVSQLLLKKNGIVAHTSGAAPLAHIKTSNSGVFYPLQSFTKGKKVDFSTIPFCIEGSNNKTEATLLELAGKLSSKVYTISSDQRKTIHLAAVLANNFSNHLFTIASSICQENKVSFAILHPLITETVEKIKHISPREAQTGPAKRKDVLTMQSHLDQLENPLHKKIYQLLSESIIHTYEEKL